MAHSLKKLSDNLQQVLNRYDDEALAQKAAILNHLTKSSFTSASLLLPLYHQLIFLKAYPSGEKEYTLTVQVLKKITTRLKQLTALKRKNFTNQGLPFCPIETEFSHDCVRWIMNSVNGKTEITSASKNADYNTLIKHLLPAVTRYQTTAGWSNDELLRVLGIPDASLLNVWIDLFNQSDDNPSIKDELWKQLGITLRISPAHESVSIAHNTFQTENIFYHHEILKRFDHVDLLNTTLPEHKKLNTEQVRNLADCIKTNMLLYARETDPTTYLDMKSLRYYELERGISIALYSMTPDRQLPLESYVGYTLFKNGLPAAYGGSWIFGYRAYFGINILDSYRGGESGYIMCQLLRTYIQLFNLHHIEVEPYQYGQDNEDGLKSGAFWFYYRYGFRPVDKELNKIAAVEYKKIQQQTGYKSSIRTLKRFTESNMVLKTGQITHAGPMDIGEAFLKYSAKHHKGNPLVAEGALLQSFAKAYGINLNRAANNELAVAKDIAVMAAMLQLKHPHLPELIKLKNENLYEYQRVLRKIIAE
jgi:hypothetical protein